MGGSFLSWEEIYAGGVKRRAGVLAEKVYSLFVVVFSVVMASAAGLTVSGVC